MTDRCETWGYFSGERCSLKPGHKGKHDFPPLPDHPFRRPVPTPDVAVYRNAASPAEAAGAPLREALERFVSTRYPNNGAGWTNDLTWTVPEKAFGELRAALAATPAPAPLDVTADAVHDACEILGLVIQVPDTWPDLYPWKRLAQEITRLTARAAATEDTE